MPRVHFTPHLRQFFELPDVHEAEADSLGSLLEALDATWPGLAFYLQDERGRIRQHVAIWVDGQLRKDREDLDVPVQPDSEVHILQALSGG